MLCAVLGGIFVEYNLSIALICNSIEYKDKSFTKSNYPACNSSNPDNTLLRIQLSIRQQTVDKTKKNPLPVQITPGEM